MGVGRHGDGTLGAFLFEVGHLHDTVLRIDEIIRQRNLPLFVTKGKIALQAGFALGLIDRNTPDDTGMVAKLVSAASAVLGVELTTDTGPSTSSPIAPPRGR